MRTKNLTDAVKSALVSVKRTNDCGGIADFSTGGAWVWFIVQDGVIKVVHVWALHVAIELGQTIDELNYALVAVISEHIKRVRMFAAQK